MIKFKNVTMCKTLMDAGRSEIAETLAEKFRETLSFASLRMFQRCTLRRGSYEVEVAGR